MRNTPRRKPDYLWVRPTTDVVWFSRAVPKRLWESEGRKVIQFPLGTTDRREAEALARRHASDLDERWGMLPASAAPTRRMPTVADLEALAVEVGHDAAMDHTDRRRREPGGWQRHINRTRRALEDFAPLAATGDTALVRGLADIALHDRGFDVSPDSEAYAKFLSDMNTAMLAAARTSHERALGNIEADTDSKFVHRVRERAAAKAKPGETIAELFERWAADRLANPSYSPAASSALQEQ